MVDRFAADTETWVDPKGRTLSERIWGNRRGLRAHIDAMVTDAIQGGTTIDDLVSHLVRYVSPTYARSGDGKARHAANRLASNEMRRGRSIATRQTAMTNPTGGLLRYTVGAGHIDPDECTDLANRITRYGRGVYPAKDCPLPPRHVGCRCEVAEVGVDARDMDAFVDSLRVEFELVDPPDMSPAELAIFRRETAQIRQDVQLMFNAWFEQVGLVTTDDLMTASPTVANWVDGVQARKRRRR